MPNDQDMDDRRGALERFAGADAAPRGEVMIPQQAFGPGADRIVGAQKVAVYRDEQRILNKLAFLAEAAGEDWYYRFPVRKKIKNDKGDFEWSTDWIEGPSIKLTNDLARLYGNCDVDVRELDTGDGWVFYARFTDFETGYSITRPFRQNKGAGRIGGADDSRRLDIAYQIGVSKAYRNVIRNALQTFADFAFEEARGALVSKIGKDVDGWRGKLLARLATIVDARRVERVMGRTRDKWLAPDIARIIAMTKAIQDGMATLDETFPPLPEAEAAKPDPMAEFAKTEKKPEAEKKEGGKRTRKPKEPDTAQAPQTAKDAPAASDGSPTQPEAEKVASDAPGKTEEAKKAPEGPPPDELNLRDVVDNAASVEKLREFWTLKVAPWETHLGEAAFSRLTKAAKRRQAALEQTTDKP